MNATTSQAADNSAPRPANASAPWLQTLKTQGFVPLLIGGAALIALVVALLLWLSTPTYRVLYSNLSEADGGQIIAELDARQITYELNGNGTISVPADQVHKLRLQLAEQGLPNTGNVGFNLLDNQAFGISQFAEKVNYQRALEGELASSMEALGPVAKARVHLAMAKDSVFVRDQQPAKASVILTLHPGRKLGQSQVAAIVHMVASSVAELAPDQVTVVDQRGDLLSQEAASGSLNGSKLDYIREVERGYQQRIEAILKPILGSDNVRAQVVADIDFSQREATAERYAPNQDPERAAIRSIQRNTNMSGDLQAAGGVPGTLSNTPPGITTAVINSGEETNTDELAASTTPQQLQQDQVVNYEVDRSVEHIQHEQGVIQRLSVAVVVDHHRSLSADGATETVPRSEEELDAIQRLVRQAMGFSAERGDQLEVINSAFIEADPATPATSNWYQTPEVTGLIAQVMRYVAAALLILGFYLLIMRPLIRRWQLNSNLNNSVTSNGQQGFHAVAGDDDGDSTSASDYKVKADPEAPQGTSAKPGAATSGNDFRWPKSGAEQHYTEALSQAKQAARDNPRQVARILQAWMNEDDNG
ncbi:flagellar basal-body MS-ring/collar protein FliF [Pseudidiomarina insulisalsae]|uniref:Flagellar M-ring protein n=1 Tax=Pseudidiomarina insulisalsae TaxID=575789 RepID=A0A432YDP6_9GAMM|nr:flagellar basal-body MS-ring/collar protein FliF [Pseudidiomarina insulisalsae]RUO59057.1 flagellar basal body M-ring protein FliF [Pseudidiomarina insulisalsae]